MFQVRKAVSFCMQCHIEKSNFRAHVQENKTKIVISHECPHFGPISQGFFLFLTMRDGERTLNYFSSCVRNCRKGKKLWDEAAFDLHFLQCESS